MTGKPYGQLRDLNKVWEKFDGVYGPKNTLMLESDEVSVHNCHKNSLIVDEYTKEDVWPSSYETYRGD